MKHKVKNFIKKNSVILSALVIVLIVIVGALYYPRIHQKILTDSPIGCYVRTLDGNLYSLNVISQEGDSVTGTLVFNIPRQISSVGTIKGTYKNGILLATYAFQANGLHSAMKVIFKKQGADFIGGYEKNGIVGDFKSLDDIIYDQSGLYHASSGPCATNI